MEKMLTSIVQLSNNKYIEEETGYLICENAILGSTGMQEYLAGELKLKGYSPTTKVKVYRPSEEVFKEESLKTLTNKAFTIMHPIVDVTSYNDKDLRKGTVYNIRRENDTIVGDIIVTDNKAIEQIKYISCLSLGYKLDLDKIEGEDNSFMARNIRYNHLALVPKGRSKVAKIRDATIDINITKGDDEMGIFNKKAIDTDTEIIKNDVNGLNEETNAKKAEVTAQDGLNVVKESTITDKIASAIIDGQLSKEDLEGFISKFVSDSDKDDEDKNKTSEDNEPKCKDEGSEKNKDDDKDIDNDNDKDKENNMDKKDIKDTEMSLKDIDAIKDPTIRDMALSEYKAKKMLDKGLTYHNDTVKINTQDSSKETNANDAEWDRTLYYRNTLNPHKNKNFRDEYTELSQVVNLNV